MWIGANAGRQVFSRAGLLLSDQAISSWRRSSVSRMQRIAAGPKALWPKVCLWAKGHRRFDRAPELCYGRLILLEVVLSNVASVEAFITLSTGVRRLRSG